MQPLHPIYKVYLSQVAYTRNGENLRNLVIIAHCGEPTMAQSHYDNAKMRLHKNASIFHIIPYKQTFSFTNTNYLNNTKTNYKYD